LSKRSDSLSAPPCIVAHPAASGWWDFFTANLPLPIVILLLCWLSKSVESRAFGAYNLRVTMLIGFNIILAVSLQLINGFSGQFSLGHAGFMAVGAYMAAYPAINLSARLKDPAGCLWFYVTLAIVAGIAGSALLLLFWGVRATRRIHSMAPGIVLLILLVWL